jgi:hypothetical protein
VDGCSSITVLAKGGTMRGAMPSGHDGEKMATAGHSVYNSSFRSPHPWLQARRSVEKGRGIVGQSYAAAVSLNHADSLTHTHTRTHTHTNIHTWTRMVATSAISISTVWRRAFLLNASSSESYWSNFMK